MSEFHVQIVEINSIIPHPNADKLEIAKVWDYPVIVRKGEYSPGQRAVYIPVDSIVPDEEPFKFLQGHTRIKAKRLRGIFSQGLLVSLQPGMQDMATGTNVQEQLKITKHDPEVRLKLGGQNIKDPGFVPIYTDIEGFKRWPDLFKEGEEVVLTEKLHGANSRYLNYKGSFWVGSHRCLKKEDPENMWWKVAYDLDLKNKLPEGFIFYGEVFGKKVQDLSYGLNDIDFRVFDVFSMAEGKYLDFDAAFNMTKSLGLNFVPVIFIGPWDKSYTALAEGDTLFKGANHVKEGFVMKPVKETWDPAIGRKILKYVGEGYLLRKQKD